jgi:tRNA G18 (ribose-2'-O)-methylase SpoU
MAEAVGTSDLVVVTEGLGDHENLGALFRNAAALGAGAVLLDPTPPTPVPPQCGCRRPRAAVPWLAWPRCRVAGRGD